jgi:formylglycine-generating enzyme
MIDVSVSANLRQVRSSSLHRPLCDSAPSRKESIDWPWHSDSFEGEIGLNRSFNLPDNWPIFHVSWYAAIYYCNWLSKQNGLDPAYDFDMRSMKSFVNLLVSEPPAVKWRMAANGFRLPTEAEWEYSAVVGDTGHSLTDEAWFRDNSNGSMHPVGKKEPSTLGLYDMLGNGREWCWDYFDPNYYHVSPRLDPTGPDHGYDPENFDSNESDIRVNRGADWSDRKDYVSPRIRFRSQTTLAAPIGLRVARSAADMPPTAP